MSLALKFDKKYTYADYLSWQEGERYEIIEGIPYLMSPAPSRIHQEISMNLVVILSKFFKRDNCKLYNAPFDVRFPDKSLNDEDIYCVVQPDILAVCDKNKLDDRGCVGAPDFIVEIISSSTAGRDTKEKFELYEKHRVKEYWIVYPEEKFIMVFTLNNEGFYNRHISYYANDVIKSVNFPELEVPVENVFSGT